MDLNIMIKQNVANIICDGCCSKNVLKNKKIEIPKVEKPLAQFAVRFFIALSSEF